MRHSSLALIAVAACCLVVRAQTPAAETVTATQIGKVTEVKGLVTMSLGANVATVQRDTPVFDGARFVAGSSGEAEIRFTDGCVLKLEPNQFVTIDGQRDCAVRIAAIETLPDSTLAGGSFFGRETLPLLGTVLLAGAITKLPDPSITPTPR
jgi:hypothetical protein